MAKEKVISVAIIGIAILAIISFSSRSCRPTTNSIFQDEVLDYIHFDRVYAKFRKADSLKLSRQFSASTEEFLSLLEGASESDKAYALNQIIYNQLALNQIEAADSYLNLFETAINLQELSSASLGDYHFNKGLYNQKVEKGQSSIFNLKRALFYYNKVYPGYHQKKIETLNELGLSYEGYTTKIDSFFTFVDSSYNLLYKHPSLNKYNPRVFYGQAYKSWYKKDHVSGENYCALAIKYSLEAPDYDTLFVAQNYAFKGRMLNKQNDKDSLALQAYKEALNIGSQIEDKELKVQLLYEEIIKYFAAKGDSIGFEKYMRIVESKFKPEDLIYIYPNRLRGFFHYYLENPVRSIFFYKIFLRSYSKKENKNIILLTEALTAIIEKNIQLNQLEEAEHYVWKMIKSLSPKEMDTSVTFTKLYSSSNFNDNYLYTSLDYLAQIYKKRYERENKSVQSLEKAFHLYTLIDTIVYRNIESFDEDAWLRFSKSYNSKINRSAIETSYLLYHEKRDRKILDWANHFIDRLKSPLLYRELISKQKETFSEVPDSIFWQEEELNRKIRALKQNEEGRNEELFAQLLKEKEWLYKKLEIEYPRYYQAKIYQPFVGVSDLQRTLTNEKEAVVNFFIGGKYFYTLIIHRDTILFERKKSLEKISSSIQWMNNYFLSADMFKLDKIRNYQDSAYTLYKTLFSRLETLLPIVNELTVIPVGNLNFTAFDALITETKPDAKDLQALNYLFKKYQVKLAFSSKAYLYQKSNPFQLKSTPKILAYAYADKTSGIFGNKKNRELAATVEELNTIKEVFPDAHTVLRYGSASKKAHFLQQVNKEEYDIYHFALHAFASPKDRLNNFILFPKDSIYGYEVISLNLGSQLAVLTSCQTAFGSYEPGEGQYSLSRAFFLSGTHTILSSLWLAEDNSMATLINFFYQHLSRGEPPSRALYLAKVDYISQANNSKAHPFYWAGFVCYG